MSLPYFPMYPTDFEADTSHLTLAEDGAYNRLLRLMWMTAGCSLPDDDTWVMRRMRCFSDEDCAVVAGVIDEFFTRKNGRILNARLAKEYQKTDLAHKKRVAAGSMGGKAKALKTNNSVSSKAKAMPKQPEPEPEPYKGDTNVSLGDFDLFWADWPSKIGKDKARKAWRGLSKENRDLACASVGDGWFNRWRTAHPDANPIHASTFLNGKRWTDEFPATPFKAIPGGYNDKSTRKSQQKLDAFVGGATGTYRA